MFVRTLFEWLNETSMSVALRESIYGYPISLTSHVVSMCLIAGLLVMMDLRLTGLGNLKTSVSDIQNRLFPWQMIGLAMAVISGGALFFAPCGFTIQSISQWPSGIPMHVHQKPHDWQDFLDCCCGLG